MSVLAQLTVDPRTLRVPSARRLTTVARLVSAAAGSAAVAGVATAASLLVHLDRSLTHSLGQLPPDTFADLEL